MVISPFLLRILLKQSIDYLFIRVPILLSNGASVTNMFANFLIIEGTSLTNASVLKQLKIQPYYANQDSHGPQKSLSSNMFIRVKTYV